MERALIDEYEATMREILGAPEAGEPRHRRADRRPAADDPRLRARQGGERRQGGGRTRAPYRRIPRASTGIQNGGRVAPLKIGDSFAVGIAFCTVNAARPGPSPASKQGPRFNQEALVTA